MSYVVSLAIKKKNKKTQFMYILYNINKLVRGERFLFVEQICKYCMYVKVVICHNVLNTTTATAAAPASRCLNCHQDNKVSIHLSSNNNVFYL